MQKHTYNNKDIISLICYVKVKFCVHILLSVICLHYYFGENARKKIMSVSLAVSNLYNLQDA